MLSVLSEIRTQDQYLKWHNQSPAGSSDTAEATVWKCTQELLGATRCWRPTVFACLLTMATAWRTCCLRAILEQIEIFLARVRWNKLATSIRTGEPDYEGSRIFWNVGTRPHSIICHNTALFLLEAYQRTFLLLWKAMFMTVFTKTLPRL